MDFTFPEELDQLRRTVRQFVDRELRPLEAEVEANDRINPQTMAELRKKSVALGLYGFNVPADFGGAGIDCLGQVVIGEEAGRTTMGLVRALGALPGSLKLATPEQRPWLVQPVVSGEKTIAIAITEAHAGSDVSAIRTRATKANGGWTLNGEKYFISSLDNTDFIAVLAVTSPDRPLKERFSLFVVRADNPGYKYLRRIPKMGWRGADLSAFALDDCFVSDDAVLGGVGGGFGAIMSSINSTRLYLSGIYNGMTALLLELGVEYAKQRKTFGQLLAERQAIQFKLASIDVELEASRMLSYKAARAVDMTSPSAHIAVSRAKYYGSELVGRAADSVLQIFGAAGYSSDFCIERIYRDARAFRIGEGSSEMQLIQIARHLLQ